MKIWRIENNSPIKEPNNSPSPETAVYYTNLVGLKVQKASEKALELLKDNQ